MTTIFFKYNSDPFLFDTEEMKLYRLRHHHQIEIKNTKILRLVRLDSVEINRKQALDLARTDR